MQCINCGSPISATGTRCLVCGGTRPDLAAVAERARADELAREKSKHSKPVITPIGTRTFALPPATPTSRR